MTVEERAKQVLANWEHLGKEFDYVLIPGTNLAELIFTEWIADALRDQIEDCAKIADAELAARRDALQAASRRNDSHGFAGHHNAFIAAETIGNKIRALAGQEADGPDDSHDLWGFECNEKPVD